MQPAVALSLMPCPAAMQGPAEPQPPCFETKLLHTQAHQSQESGLASMGLAMALQAASPDMTDYEVPPCSACSCPEYCPLRSCRIVMLM